jgi:trimeric autotransporter adhesin
VTGQANFPCMIGSFGPLNQVTGDPGPDPDGIVFALSAATGATIWARTFGGVIADGAKGQAICKDNAGRVYISGTFVTYNDEPTAYFGTAGAFARSVRGNMSEPTSDLFVAQLNAATGAFNWVSTGGAASQETPQVIGEDNAGGSGIVFLPVQNQLLVTGSFANANAAWYSNGAATPSVSLTNAGLTDICLLRMDLSGNFLSALSAGGSNTEEAPSVSYDATTSAAYISGYFKSATVSGAFNLTNSAAGLDEIYYARYNPATNSFAWAKSAAGSAGGNDRVFANDVGPTGMYITGRFQGTISFSTGASAINASSVGFDDVFLAKIDPATGNTILLASAGSNTSGTDAGTDVAVSTNNDVWVGGIFGGGTLSFTPGSPLVSVTAGVDLELFIARYNDPMPLITTQPSPSTACQGLPASFTVTATASIITYQWQESTDAAFSAPITLTNTGIYSGVNTATLTIADNTTVNGRYYRVILSNGAGTVVSNGALLTATAPSLPAVHTSQMQAANTLNNVYYGPSCRLIAKVVPSGASAVTGTITSEVWVESTVPAYNSKPFVQRHYQITPAVNPLTATATVTLFFSQAEFNAFNTAPGSTANLPTGPSDNTGKANLRIDKYNGSSNNGSGLPGTYTSTSMIIDPPDGNIIWNAITSMWEITFNVTGFSGFMIHTNHYVLPVTLLSFAAQLTGDKVKVSWTTSEELSHAHFELERSTDGRSFTSIASIEPSTGSGIKNYAYTDAGASQLNTSKIYYRLKMVSISGDAEYSHIVTVHLTPSSTPVTLVAPNPFQNKLEVGLQLPENSQVKIQLTDIYGKQVLQENAQAPKGSSTYVMSKAGKIIPGVYLLTVAVGGQSYSFKVLKQL